MIPIRDRVPTHSFPAVNYALIAVNIIVFIFQWMAGANQEAVIYEFALIPASVTAGLDVGDVRDIFTSMFMHGGLLHIAGNMLYLWIFGDNVEDNLGKVKYLIFYLVGGVVASLAHIVSSPNSQIPTVGASGAIAAVLGAYLVLYPSAKVETFIPLGFFMRLAVLPASIVLGLWFVLQLFNGVMSIGAADVGGVAFWAHIGGFVAGVVLAFLFGNRRRARPEVAAWQ